MGDGPRVGEALEDREMSRRILHKILGGIWDFDPLSMSYSLCSTDIFF